MEQILYLYTLPYDPARPLICFDERPCVLRDDVVTPLPMQPGRPARYDHEYKRNGTCSMLVALEPLSGYRYVEISRHRKRADYTGFMQRLAQQYASADRIVLVQDNLNTHHAGSFYASLPADEAFRLAQRFEMYYTPKKGSWLNMAEIEISALVRQCLQGRRMATIDRMAAEVSQVVKERNKQRVRVNWQFTPELARQKLRRHYDKILGKN